MKIKVYVAGKVSENSVFGTHDWRDGFCKQLSEKSGLEIFNLDPTKSEGFDLNQNNPNLIFGRNAFMIILADLIVVNLTDDISVGGSQEMLVAKYYKKPLFGLARKGGKFNREEEFKGRVYKNYIHPYVSISCDKVAENMEELAKFIKDFFSKSNNKIKDLSIIDQTVDYYKREHYHLDRLLRI